MAILPYRESKIHLISLMLVQLRVHVNHFFRNRKDGSIAVFLPGSCGRQLYERVKTPKRIISCRLQPSQASSIIRSSSKFSNVAVLGAIPTRLLTKFSSASPSSPFRTLASLCMSSTSA